MTGISIIIPVGPDQCYKDYLPECLHSIIEQMEAGDELLIVDDRANLESEFFAPIPMPDGAHLYYVKNDWLLGCAASWNIGVGLASNENCILMGSDDKLLDGALESCRQTIAASDYDPLGYYNLTCQIQTGEVVSAYNNAAMVTKKLWHHLGGFPPSAGVGAPDALIVSIMMIHLSQHMHQIREGHPLYFCRVHEGQDTRRQGAFFSYEVILIRDRETARWTPARWD